MYVALCSPKFKQQAKRDNLWKEPKIEFYIWYLVAKQAFFGALSELPFVTK